MKQLWGADENNRETIQFGVVDFCPTGGAAVSTTIFVNILTFADLPQSAMDRVACMYAISQLNGPSLVEAKEFLTNTYIWQIEQRACVFKEEGNKDNTLPSGKIEIVEGKPMELYD
jgi:hypothetical protein